MTDQQTKPPEKISKNFAWNLLGAGLPLVVAIFTIPLLVSGLGQDRFGLLTLAWIIVGYFSLFDPVSYTHLTLPTICSV